MPAAGYGFRAGDAARLLPLLHRAFREAGSCELLDPIIVWSNLMPVAYGFEVAGREALFLMNRITESVSICAAVTILT